MTDNQVERTQQMIRDNQVQLAARIDAESYDRLSRIAFEEDRTISSLLRRIVRNYLQELDVDHE